MGKKLIIYFLYRFTHETRTRHLGREVTMNCELYRLLYTEEMRCVQAERHDNTISIQLSDYLFSTRVMTAM